MLTAPAFQDTSTTAQTADIASMHILEVELGRTLPVLSAFNATTNQQYQHARCLVRLHDHPLGIVEFVFEESTLSPGDYMPLIWNSLKEQISAHLQQDGLPAITQLEPEGVTSSEPPLCIKEREAFFADAPFVSIIVSTHDRAESLSCGLPALLSQHYPRYEIVIVDNAPSTDATAQLIQQKYSDLPHLRYVREDRPGLSKGLNRGIREARGEIFAFTDDDVIVDAYWLLQLVRAFSVVDNVACVTGLILPRELETPAQFWFEEYGGFSKGFKQRIYDMADYHPREPLYPYTAGSLGAGASMAFRATFLRSVGGFDPALQAGMDIAAFFQVIRQGHRLVYQPAALAYHTHRRTYLELQKQIYSYGVALTAYLTKNILDNPRLLLEMLVKIPYGFFFTLSSQSPKNKKKSCSYPKSLTRLELQGLLTGPFVYWRRRQALAPADHKLQRVRENAGE